MALDAATLSLTALELEKKLTDAKIDKIFEPTKDEVVLSLRTRAGGIKLFVSARSGSARVCLTNESFENPMVPPSFCMLLRKHFAGGRFLRVRTIESERIVFFDFQCTNEMGDSVQNTLAAELMGRYSNIVLINENNKIIDALKRVDFEDSDVRQLLPGLAYTLPPKPDKVSFLSCSPIGILSAISDMEVPVPSALMKVTGGVGPVVCREAAYRAMGEGNTQANELDVTQKEALISAIENIQADYKNGGVPVMVLSEDNRPTEFSFTALTQYGEENLRYKEEFSLLLEDYYATKDKAERLRQKSKELHKSVRNMYERSVRKQAARKEELAESHASEKLRVYGELLNANLWAFNKGDANVTLTNWYDGTEVKIPLEIRLSPSANAQKYFKEYKKKQTAAKMLEKLLKDGESEIKYLETVLYEVEIAKGEAELGEIRTELKAGGYLKYYKVKDKKQKPADFYRYTSSDGFLILAGRNNLQNEKLTLKTARGKDLWFHVKNAPGSHVVVMSEGEDIPNSTKNEAAQLAVIHSGQTAGAKVAVDFTEVKNIRKTGDLPPGMVLYDTYETAYITAQAGIEERLAHH
ncbi:MAG: NFACT RNA binding domain-containing protein [Oscillospiraceae bacterium]